MEENSPKSKLFGIDPRTGEIILGKYRISMPKSRPSRIALGILLILGGMLWFLPILGIWMLPLGLLILSNELSVVRNLRRRLTVWWERRKSARTADH